MAEDRAGDDAPRSHGDGVSRAEFEDLKARLLRIETSLRARGFVDTVDLPAGLPIEALARAPAPKDPAVLTVARASESPVLRGASRSTERSLEATLGERFAPRVGAVLVFLAGLFFLGLAVQRGWIGPLGQLAIAAAGGFALIGAGAWLTQARGYGTYPQVLEGTGASLLYATAFAAHALPYYAPWTGLTEVGGGILMALVAAGTVLLALVRDSRVIVSLGYSLAFVTAGLGFGALPGLTLAYVSLLGLSLAWLVAHRGWAGEALVGTLATGAFFLAFSAGAGEPGNPSPWAVVGLAVPTVAAFIWITLSPALAARRPESARTGSDPPVLAGVAFVSVAWATFVFLSPFWPAAFDRAKGLVLLASCLASATLAFLTARSSASGGVPVAYGAAAVLLFLAWPPFLWSGAGAPLLVTATYALGAFALALVDVLAPRRDGGKGPWVGGLALMGVAGFKAATFDAFAASLVLPLALMEAVLVAGLMLAMFHLARQASLPGRPGDAALVAASAVVLGSFTFPHSSGPVTSILLGLLGGGFLAAGFVIDRASVYRYTGFAVLAFVVLRVFTIDLRETDLAVRAVVFALLGALLLGVGYAYSRAQRGSDSPREPR